MTRTVRCALRALPLVCLVAVSCADGMIEPQLDREHAVAANAPPSHANPSAFTAGGGAGNGKSASEPCAASNGTPAATDSTSEPLPGDLCSIAEFVRNAPHPGAQIAAAFIDSTGGSLRLGDFEIVVPPGAVQQKTRFSIALPPAAAARRAMAEFKPHNVSFAVPVTIRLPLATTNAAPDAPVTWWSRNGEVWVDQPTTPTADGRIEAQVGHFSYYATRFRRGITIAGG